MGRYPTDNRMKLLFELSGENPTLPCAEIECVATVLDSRPQVAVAECPVPGDARRLAMTHVVLDTSVNAPRMWLRSGTFLPIFP